jgi:hypothetical protein
MQTWTSEEIKEIILFAKSLQSENEDLRAKMIAMDAMLKNEMAKVKLLKQILQNNTL